MNTRPSARPSLLTVFGTFFKVGSFTFGGGFAMIPIIQREVVDKQKWLSDQEFVDTIAITQAAPGPVAVNSAVFIGYRLSGIPGAVAALAGTVLPSFIIILVIAIFLTTSGQHVLLQKFFAGVRPAVIALILAAGLSIGRKSLGHYPDYLAALAALFLLLFLDLHPILLILLGALWGLGQIPFKRQKEAKRP